MKKRILFVCLVIPVLLLWGCGNYVPQSEDFDLQLVIDKTAYFGQESIAATAEFSNKSKRWLKIEHSTPLIKIYIAKQGEEADMTSLSDRKSRPIGRTFRYETEASFSVQNYEAGDYYIFA